MRTPRAASVVLIGAVVAATSALVVVAVRADSNGGTLRERTVALAETIRCPVCQDLSVADSPSTIAREFRRTIARQLAAGRSPDQVRSFFVQRYGESILLSPTARGLNLVAWLGPALLFALGLLILLASLRRWHRRPEPPQLSEQDRRFVQRELERTEADG